MDVTGEGGDGGKKWKGAKSGPVFCPPLTPPVHENETSDQKHTELMEMTTLGPISGSLPIAKPPF